MTHCSISFLYKYPGLLRYSGLTCASYLSRVVGPARSRFHLAHQAPLNNSSFLNTSASKELERGRNKSTPFGSVLLTNYLVNHHAFDKRETRKRSISTVGKIGIGVGVVAVAANVAFLASAIPAVAGVGARKCC